jgi:hypothetical protein
MEVLEEVMATVVFPGIDPATGLPAVIKGLAFDVQKRPQFSNKIVEHTSGAETATSYWQNPKWDYTLTFDYLPDYPKSVGDSDLRMMMGFFLSMQGRFQAWLFTDPDDYQVTAGFQRTFDGVTTQFNLVRGMAGFYEPVGQLKTGTLSLWMQADETQGYSRYSRTLHGDGQSCSCDDFARAGGEDRGDHTDEGGRCSGDQ